MGKINLLRAISTSFALTAVLGLAMLGSLRPASATEIQRVVSKSGIVAWLVEEHSVPLISIRIGFTGGASEDPLDKQGLANMASALLDEGAGKLDSQAFQAKLEELSIKLSFTAARDNFYGNLKTLSRHKDEALGLFKLALTEPRFDKNAMERIRDQIVAGLRQAEQNPGSVAGKEWFKAVFGNHHYGRPVSGNPKSVANINSDDLKQFVKNVFARDRLKIAVVGDIDAETLKRDLDRLFSDLPEKGAKLKLMDAEIVSGPIRKIIDMNIPQTVIRFGQRGIARKDKDFVAAYIVNHILGGGGFTSRLYTEVREKRGLAYSVYTYLYPLDYAALLVGGVATQNERAAESLKTIEAELVRIAKSGPTEAELAAAKSYLTGSYALRFDTSGKIAGQLLAIQMEDLGIDYINIRNGLIDAVSEDDVKRVAKGLLQPGKLIVTVVGRPTGLEEIKPGG